MIMSHCGISVVINVRLYDIQDALKTDARKNVSCITLNAEMLCIMKNIYMAAIAAYLKG